MTASTQTALWKCKKLMEGLYGVSSCRVQHLTPVHVECLMRSEREKWPEMARRRVDKNYHCLGIDIPCGERVTFSFLRRV